MTGRQQLGKRAQAQVIITSKVLAREK